MKVILRKSDSATSLLLFIYNNYLTHYNKDTIKLSSLLKLMETFGKSETATRMSLSRTVKAGILINSNDGSEVSYTLDSNGREAISTWNEGMQQFWKRYASRNKPWDKKWYLVNLEFSEAHKEHRTTIVEKLQQNGFGNLSTNTWISPYHQTDEIQKLLIEFHINTGVVELYGEMTIYQDMVSFLDNVFKLKELEKSYENFIRTFSEKLAETKKLYQEEWFVEGGHSLPLLHALGWEFLSIATDDATLPITLYPAWAGDEAAQLMIEFRRILLEATIKYLGKLD
ncbi:PaaX family transcriptional regulator C-terminal domain-containing protein [Desulfosporosinus sp. BICA1-9]|uniref:PaaX family transcriptional regulator n=1 Tax=Desulfosporosinus sp. BICA1-9 TaxID=1531958 RepID=UPI00054C22F0|nr:PaaX family transcriptional regulator C-terminal domain-containing protein [Desulfosporosinus sp. BICA1-9]KJS46182.1 MAG: hypothetical protein VR66_26960 [Peptococcaceae bacterium BRH_c23]KJS90096.1 MAG: hypothetical protein JL57_03930 [Desulfosporosinus sp. BICA1-9]HBW36335.1 hypothetical protein [Desulfosporosinus sp.]